MDEQFNSKKRAISKFTQLQQPPPDVMSGYVAKFTYVEKNLVGKNLSSSRGNS